MIGETIVTVECEWCRGPMQSTQANVLDFSFVAACSNDCRAELKAHHEMDDCPGDDDDDK